MAGTGFFVAKNNSSVWNLLFRQVIPTVWTSFQETDVPWQPSSSLGHTKTYRVRFQILRELQSAPCLLAKTFRVISPFLGAEGERTAGGGSPREGRRVILTSGGSHGRKVREKKKSFIPH